jgi:hypothetical protein
VTLDAAVHNDQTRMSRRDSEQSSLHGSATISAVAQDTNTYVAGGDASLNAIVCRSAPPSAIGSISAIRKSRTKLPLVFSLPPLCFTERGGGKKR